MKFLRSNIKNTISFVFQLFLIIAIYFGYVCYIYEKINFANLLNTGLIIILATWLLTAWLTHKYKPQYYQRKWVYVIAPFPKAAFFNLLFIYLFSCIFLEPFYENGLLYKVTIIYAIIELLIYSIITLINGLTNHEGQSGCGQVNKYLQDDLKIDNFTESYFDYNEIDAKSFYFKEEITHKLYPIDHKIDSKNKYDVKIIRSVEEVSAVVKPCEIIILDIKINDLKDINKVIKSIYNSTVPGGYLFAVYKTLDDFEKEYLLASLKSIRFLKKIFYYLYYRAFPKIPYLNIIYKLISGGKNKVISKAEVWGRLFYNGYDIEKQITVKGISYLIARKVKTPSENPAPSFFPIIKLIRVSLYGHIIQIHKIRSMYPYSEFLQKKVFEDGSLTTTGKYGNDFRITEFGRIFRKYWIDEIPQLIDWFRGKIKLVGIRAMSQHYFSLYPEEYRDLYYKVKPGIISPIFDENTDGFDDIVRIEREYLKRYLDNSIKTDFKYFFITLKHIFKGVRGI